MATKGGFRAAERKGGCAPRSVMIGGFRVRVRKWGSALPRTKAGFRGIRKLLSAGIGLEAYTITSARLVQLDLHLRRRRCFSFGMDDDDDGSPPPNRVGHAQQHLGRNVAGMASHNRRLAEQWMVVGASLLSPALPVQRTAFDSAAARCLGTFVKNFVEAVFAALSRGGGLLSRATLAPIPMHACRRYHTPGFCVECTR